MFIVTHTQTKKKARPQTQCHNYVIKLLCFYIKKASGDKNRLEGGFEQTSILNVKKQRLFLQRKSARFLFILVSHGNGWAFSEIFTPTQQPQHCAVLLYQLILSISKPSAFPLQHKKRKRKKKSMRWKKRLVYASKYVQRPLITILTFKMPQKQDAVNC